MAMQYEDLVKEWETLLRQASESARLSQLKEFRDDIQCLVGFSDELGGDFQRILSERFPLLRPADIYDHSTREVQLKIGNRPDPSEESVLLRNALLIDSRVRHVFRNAEPTHRGWSSWRRQQIKRYSSEDSSAREKQIMYIPFAIELTQGCSGGCSFCGLSAPKLSGLGNRFSEVEDEFRELLLELRTSAGRFGQCGILYWATDPLDHDEYTSFARVFEEVFDIFPGTTTALGETYPSRLKALINSNARKRPWGRRCSLRNQAAYKTIKRVTSASQRFGISFIPQFINIPKTKALAGRQLTHESIDNQQSQGGSIACMTGLLINLPSKHTNLITPCLAEAMNPNGYRTVIAQLSKKDARLAESVSTLINELPTPSVNINDRVMMMIDPSQYNLYKKPGLPDLLKDLDQTPRSLKQLVEESQDLIDSQLSIRYYLELIQHGVLRVCR